MKKELLSTYDVYDSFVYNNRIENAFQLEYITSLDDDIKNNAETRKFIEELQSELEKIKKSLIEELKTEKDKADQAKNKVSSLETSLKEMMSEKMSLIQS
ncbi:hypothetical protein [Mycoplasma capricolum]|uniref:hypothetical protein n=1 Tax=Mycoplasma capricolum TaxID=2095 RepID=UPI001FB5F76F|nr:hypothetical protein [Mycoplasma capricolum]